MYERWGPPKPEESQTRNHWFLRRVGESPFLLAVPGTRPRYRIQAQPHPPRRSCVSLSPSVTAPRGAGGSPRPNDPHPPAAAASPGVVQRARPGRDPAPSSAARTAPGRLGRAPGKWRREQRQRLTARARPAPSARLEGEAEHSPRQPLDPPAAPDWTAAARDAPAATPPPPQARRSFRGDAVSARSSRAARTVTD